MKESTETHQHRLQATASAEVVELEDVGLDYLDELQRISSDHCFRRADDVQNGWL
jgi:hypothetical protein